MLPRLLEQFLLHVSSTCNNFRLRCFIHAIEASNLLGCLEAVKDRHTHIRDDETVRVRIGREGVFDAIQCLQAVIGSVY
jgi:hypothetical protein